jgi:phospholipid transport system substrate-binding protein
MKKNLWAIMAILLAAFAPATPAADVAPDQLVRDVTGEVLEILRTDKDIASGDHKKLNALVEQKVLPHFNFTRMTQIAVGRDWRTASPAQQQQLTDEFRALLVRTYSSALTNYRDQTVEVKPLRLAAGDTDVQVRSLLRQPGQKPLDVDYWLRKEPGSWKVYDIVVAGVSLVVNYRETFGQEIRAGGIDGLIKSLQAKNGAPVAETARK